MSLLDGFSRDSRTWAICRNEGRLGLVPIQVLLETIKSESSSVWRSVRKGDFELRHSMVGYGKLIRPLGHHVVTVADSPGAFLTLTDGLFIILAQFKVPQAVMSLSDAYEMVHGRPFGALEQVQARIMADLYDKYRREGLRPAGAIDGARANASSLRKYP